MDATWNGYATFAGDDPMLVDFDPALEDPSLPGDLPALLRVELEVIAPDSRGQPSPAEARHLDREQALLQELLAPAGARVVARTTLRGTRELILALPAPGRADYPVRKWARKLEREVVASPVEDGWAFVDRHVRPGPGERLWMEARDAATALLEDGVGPGTPVRLVVDGHARPVPLDPFAIVAALGPDPGDWHLERG